MTEQTTAADDDRDDTPGYEQARAELADIVRSLESGGQTLEESLALWQRGEKLADVCQSWLDGARHRLDEAIAAHDAPGDAPDNAQHTVGDAEDPSGR